MDCCDDLFAGVGVGGVGGMIVYRKSGAHCLAGRLVADGVVFKEAFQQEDILLLIVAKTQP